MESLLPAATRTSLEEYASFVRRDKHAELECKVLTGQIHTKDVADRMVKTIQELSTGAVIDQHYATFSYSDGTRVTVPTPESIHKVCTTNSFRGVPLSVDRKRKYFDVVTATHSSDTIDVPDLSVKFTLRHEDHLRKDFTGQPMDATSYCRILHRKSWKSLDGIVRIDMSTVKTKLRSHKTFADVLKQTPSYELEVEIINRDVTEKQMIASMIRAVEALATSFQGSPFLLPGSDIQRYRMEFEMSKIPFINPVTMERRHIRADRPNNILSGYTVTNKADGERSFLVVVRDKRLLRITPSSKITWTGLVATKDLHIGDVVDGEYIAEKNLFCVFDVYTFRGKDTRRLPLFTTDEDIMRDPTKSRLGCAREFVADLGKDFSTYPGKQTLRIVTKLFLAGDGPSMQDAIRKMLDTKFEYETDGLIFTPRATPVAPMNERRGNAWLSVYKWKPASQNSIDFLVKFKPGESFDPVLARRVVKGSLFVSRSPGSDIVYPCETITGEYVPPQLPADLRNAAENRDRIPSHFQPAIPRAPDAYVIQIPLNDRGVPIDQTGTRIEDNTIIECAYDTETARWIIMRTRYDKTYQYRVQGKPQFGNDSQVADAIWTNIHVPVTEQMIRDVTTSPPDDTYEDDLYYRDNLEARDRILRDVYGFHNRIKDILYRNCIKPGDTLLEIAVGQGGDFLKWKRTRPSRVVGFDISNTNLISPKKGACVRYLKEKAQNPNDFMPPVLFIVGDMTEPLFEANNTYVRMITGLEPATTPYLEGFVGLTEFDAISCQFAIHYACESEEKFAVFAENLKKHGKGMFFGTCLDGAAVYALMLGKQKHVFRTENQIFGEFNKQYDDGGSWTEEFGKGINVLLESFEQPQLEYLVPFGRVTEMMRKAGYELVGTKMFNEHYDEQNGITITPEQQSFSFIHRSFVFQRTDEVQKVEVPMIPDIEEKKEEKEEKKEEKEKPKKKILKKAPGEEPVLFFGADEGKGEWRMFSNMYPAKMQIDSITFASVEHYFQWSKAKLFGDGATAEKIMKTPSAKAVKALGKKAKDFKEEEWNAKKDEIMRTALKAKLMQHPDIKAKLVETGTRPIGEANARDKYWGIGTGVDTAKAKDSTKWPGKNVLGKMLMDLRTELKE